jgi:two-component system, cell cycle sensor histidine kinase PleC
MFPLNRKTRFRTNARPDQDDSVARIAISEDGVIAYASSSFAALAGREPSELVNADAATVLRFTESKHPFTAIRGAQKIRLSNRREPLTFHFDWLTTKDQRRYLIGSAVPPRKDRRESTGFIIEQKILQTKRKSPAKPLDSREDLQRFADLTQEIMLVADEFGDLLRVNDTFTVQLGYTRADLEKINLLDLFHTEDRPFVRNTVQSEGNEFSSDFEARVITKSGEERRMEWRHVQHDGLSYCLGRDITSIRRQEKALLRRADQLREAESIARMGNWRWQIGEEEILWSDELYKIFGVTRETFKPSLETMNAMINRRDINKVNQAFQRAIIEQNDYDMEFRVKRPDGEERMIHCEGRCAIDSKGEAVALYGIMQDMTERLAHERALKEAKDSAERAYAAKTQFLANMSHELRTPLNAIIGFSEMIQQQLLGPVGNPKYLDYINGVHESGEHLLNIISDILDMSKIEAGKYELTLEEVNVLKIIKLALHMMESRALDNEVKITVAKTDENTVIIADRRAFLQIVLNLLSNAVKFSHKGGKVTIQCNLIVIPASPSVIPAKAGIRHFIEVKVTDHGIGIPAHKLASITNPFEQVSSSYTRDHEGTGLGLAITKELIELHGGTLSIESALGKGTSVTIRMPLDAGKV